MNFLNVLGIIFAAGVLFLAMVFGNDSPERLLDPHGALIVIGGTIACIGVSSSITRSLQMVLIFFQGMIRSTEVANKVIIRELMEFAEAYRSNNPRFGEMLKKCNDPFMKESLQALVDEVLDSKKLYRVLGERVNTIYERYNEDAKLFVSCGKFPPAMGLMGAVLGMIALLGSLGKAGAEKNIGPALSVAMIATLYGIALANLFIIPIGENLSERAKRLRVKNRIIVEGVRHISQKVNPIVLAEELNSFLLPSERVDWKKLLKEGKVQKAA